MRASKIQFQLWTWKQFQWKRKKNHLKKLLVLYYKLRLWKKMLKLHKQWYINVEKNSVLCIGILESLLKDSQQIGGFEKCQNNKVCLNP